MLREKIEKDLLQGRKDKNELVKKTLQTLKGEIEKEQIKAQYELSDSEVLSVVNREIKQINQTLDSAKKANRLEMIKESESQIEFLSKYLPKRMSKEEIIEAVNKLGFQPTTNTGLIIGKFMSVYKDKVDGSYARAVIEKHFKLD